MSKAMVGVFRGNFSLQGLSNVGDVQTEKTPKAVLTHWSRGSLTIGLFSSGL